MSQNCSRSKAYPNTVILYDMAGKSAGCSGADAHMQHRIRTVGLIGTRLHAACTAQEFTQSAAG